MTENWHNRTYIHDRKTDIEDHIFMTDTRNFEENLSRISKKDNSTNNSYLSIK